MPRSCSNMNLIYIPQNIWTWSLQNVKSKPSSIVSTIVVWKLCVDYYMLVPTEFPNFFILFSKEKKNVPCNVYLSVRTPVYIMDILSLSYRICYSEEKMLTKCCLLFALVLTYSLNPVPLVHAQDDNPPGLYLLLCCLWSC